MAGVRSFMITAAPYYFLAQLLLFGGFFVFLRSNSASQRPSDTSTFLGSNTPFRFEAQPSKISPDRVQLLILIITGPKEIARRAAIRQTWARKSHLARFNVSCLFVMGRAESPQLSAQIDAEQRRFGDLLTDVSFKDTYRSLTYKIISAFFWVVSQHWQDLRHIVKLDSDCFPKVDVMERLSRDLWRSQRHEPHIVGLTWQNATVRRTGKWAVSRSEVSLPVYPDYANGPTYLVSLSAAERMFNLETLRQVRASQTFWLEDVFITGILRSRLNVKLIDKGELFLIDQPVTKSQNWYKKMAKKSFVSMHALKNDNEFFRLQRETEQLKSYG